MSHEWRDIAGKLGDVIGCHIYETVTSEPDRELTKTGFRWACAIALKEIWSDVKFSEAADWLTEYVEVPVGTKGYTWTLSAARDAAREYAVQFGE